MLEHIAKYKQHKFNSISKSLSYIVGIGVLCGLLLLLSACTNPFQAPAHGSSDSTLTTDTTPTLVVSPTPAYKPTPISLQVVGCPTLSINWDKLVGTRANVNKVQVVTCSSLEGTGTLDALVNVRYYSPDAKLDVYVYDNLIGTPVQRFKVQGLLDGDAQISPTGTVMTAEIGPHGVSNLAQNLFKEYKWNGSNFGQILFPGMYPDMTHYQAEKDQALFVSLGGTSGKNSWETSGVLVTEHLVSDIFRWQSVNKVVLKNNTVDPIIVQIINLGPGGGGFDATLYHLDGNYNNILEITSISSIDGSATLTNPTPNSQLTSPIKVSSSYTAGTGILGRVALYDDTYALVGDTSAIKGSATSGTAVFSPSVTYHLNASGLQEGVVAFYASNQNNIGYTNQVVMVKVFFSS